MRVVRLAAGIRAGLRAARLGTARLRAANRFAANRHATDRLGILAHSALSLGLVVMDVRRDVQKVRGEDPDESSPTPPGYGEVDGDPFEPSDLDALRRSLDWSDLGQTRPSHVESLAEDLEHVTPHDLDARLRTTLRALQP